ncbi:O-antigen ligase family protein [Bacillus sp. B190/17]|uniref:O-antigen ligase family protein n=1 Tax=Bacillus lumedeiriae TaxID=3058829 RepID=A0ABW8IB32_9BACI
MYPLASIRITLGIVLLLFCYFILKSILSQYSEHAIQKAIAEAGLLFNAVSLVLYVIGLKSLASQEQGEMISSYGVLLDREYPRLIGLLEDPNLYIFYNTLFIAYFLTNMKSWRNKAGFLLCLVTSILTFSRGGLLAMILMVLLYLVISSPATRWKTLVTIGGVCSAAGYMTASIMKFDIGQMLEARIEDFSSDGGSGRFELWSRAWEYFLSNPLMGIGADNFIEYNKVYYGEGLYTHNTFLQILSESGLLGFSLYFTFLLLVVIQLMNRRLMKEKPYLFLSFIAFFLQIMSLSLIINEVFFLYLAILSAILQKEERKQLTTKQEGKEIHKHECLVNDG